jgi:nitric oxide reductase subunit B
VNAFIEWMRFPGDAVFIIGGILPLLWLTWLGIRHTGSVTTLEEPEAILFTEITETVEGVK